MVVISLRFAVLASLCAVLSLVLPPPVDAAHLYGGYSMEKYTSSPYFQQRTRMGNGLFRGSTAAHGHDSKDDGHQVPNRRASEPPLLRRYRPHGQNKVHNQQVQHPHDHANHKVPRSAFAQSRYRQHFSRRSSIYVPGEHGDMYSVSRISPRDWGHGDTDTDKQSSHVYDRRQVDQSNLVTGRIDIMGDAQSPGSTQRLASLAVGSTPVDWASGQSSAKAFPLSASMTNQTQFTMMLADENMTGNLNKQVTLATEVFDANSTEMIMYCATYDPDPGASSALVMTPCTGTIQSAALADDAADPCPDDENDASSSNLHESQIFSYDPSSGRIEPILATASSSGTGNSSNDLTSCGGARVRRDNGNSTTSGSVRPSSTSTSTAPTASASGQARNVTLVYVADALEVPAPSSRSSNTTSTTGTANMSMGQVAFLTTTITTTVVATVTSPGPSTRTVTPAQAAASVSSRSVPSQSTTVAAPSTAPTTISKAPANADQSLEVEMVGNTSSTTTSYPLTSTATMTTTTMTSPYSSRSASASLDALVVASSLANAMVSRGLVYASASVAQ